MPNSSPSLPLHGRHALVTGAGRGIGAAVVEGLAAAGASVTLVGRRRETLDQVAQRVASAGTAARVITADVTDEHAVDTAFREAAKVLRPVDILVNNAGVADSAPLSKMSLSDWNRTLAVNLTGVFLCCRAALPPMEQRGFGRIVTIASTAGLRGYPYVAAYAASKHGVIGLTRSLALECARKGITINAVCPGYTETDMLARTVENIQEKTGRSAEDARAALSRLNPQGRFVQPDEVARAVVWLCMPGSESVTGQAIAVAGGEVM
ncbi:SDR family NAD(P)-dependent oxidoreductase [Haliangium ochraceum]|uniref:Short-chain dehydrogenase/reductase SDR n=1 Tax=Haliangium ochraceum (strain DSM 14365 / JCM 11303 / SMP-2) TaxID=502025 RepID=D0LU12_HALO1|nr:SDR family NAD(P)-dependent oxidoreductase [Haliangium ochraceum]ACY17376.1 short-chain dehydrogenase/reductase SDR [Haliangium ochraceum DSM 14365]